MQESKYKREDEGSIVIQEMNSHGLKYSGTKHNK